MCIEGAVMYQVIRTNIAQCVFLFYAGYWWAATSRLRAVFCPSLNYIHSFFLALSFAILPACLSSPCFSSVLFACNYRDQQVAYSLLQMMQQVKVWLRSYSIVMKTSQIVLAKVYFN